MDKTLTFFIFLHDPPSQPPYKTIWKPKIILKIFVLGHEKLAKISKKFDTYSFVFEVKYKRHRKKMEIGTSTSLVHITFTMTFILDVDLNLDKYDLDNFCNVSRSPKQKMFE